MRFKLFVPFSDKEEVKSKGAFWDAAHKTWYLPNTRNLNDFLKWIDTEKNQLILETPVYIAHNYRECWSCCERTKVISIYSDGFYQFDYDSDLERQVYSKNSTKTFFLNITFLGEEITEFINKYYPFFKLAYSRTIRGKYWANHCQGCNSLQGHNFNHSEPGGPFFPLDEDDCKKITLKKIILNFDIGITGDYSYSTLENEIFNLAKRQ